VSSFVREIDCYRLAALKQTDRRHRMLPAAAAASSTCCGAPTDGRTDGRLASVRKLPGSAQYDPSLMLAARGAEIARSDNATPDLYVKVFQKKFLKTAAVGAALQFASTCAMVNFEEASVAEFQHVHSDAAWSSTSRLLKLINSPTDHIILHATKIVVIKYSHIKTSLAISVMPRCPVLRCHVSRFQSPHQGAAAVTAAASAQFQQRRRRRRHGRRGAEGFRRQDVTSTLHASQCRLTQSYVGY